jgi:malate dehydrogenase (quinone)
VQPTAYRFHHVIGGGITPPSGTSARPDGMQFSRDPKQKIAEVGAADDGRGGTLKQSHRRRPWVATGHRRELRRDHRPVRRAISRPSRSSACRPPARCSDITRNDGWHLARHLPQPEGPGSDGHTVDARFLFLGAGGGALHLLQKSGVPEGDDYAGFPVGGSFLVTDNAAVAGRHLAKAYGKASVGSPPMSVPHLDTRMLDGKQVLLFGPFATFSTKFLKEGSYFDLPASVTLDNIAPMMRVGWDEFDLVRYLAEQLMQSDDDRMAALREYFPRVNAPDWRLWQAGQRVQIIKRDPEKGGLLKLGTEIVSSRDRSIAALLGASPGASTAAPIMLDLLKRVFPDQLATPAWQEKIRRMVPSYGTILNQHPELVAAEWP